MVIVKRLSALFLFLLVVSGAAVLSGCGGGANSSVVDEIMPASVNASIIAESVKVEKNAEGVTINYKTMVPVANSSVVTSDFAFNNAPLWSEFHTARSADKLNHTVKIAKTSSANHFMIFNSPADKFDNNGKGIKID